MPALLYLLGQALIYGYLAFFIFTLVWLFVVHLNVQVYEEPNLRGRFGESCERYRAHVRRWIPGPRYEG
jgi:protein-S-isoprenylcysteine O-methyltransferase Ste14